ncbi:glutathione ABC transporter substrate-binding protein [Halalkalibacillus halophilus]|uniref:glutathione ABC transporter substrate-binding protein n=1 Tax=Halalkalibacillus halophilus TaxID=392827 RepID=UPI00041495B2|nr:glutathione ABC transporter substrate-binding protein [Halalkalibacillus halophilus]
MKKIIKVAVLILFLAFIVACADDSDETSDQNQEEELTVDLGSLPASLDPHAANDGNSLYVMTNIYDTLVQMNTDLEIEPGLAESLEPVEDTVWEAKIREGVTFHDHSELNAEVVKMNLDRVRDPEVGSSLAFLFDMIEEVEVVDEYTVHIHTAYPFSALPSHLAHPGGHIISGEVIEEDYQAMEEGQDPLTEVNQNPIGTGYFQFEEIVQGEYIRLVKNEDYWDDEASVDAITFKAVPEDSTRIAELQTGEADIIYPVNANDVETIESEENLRVQQSESASMSYLGFNMEKEPFDDERVRQAINMAIDKNALIDGLQGGIPIPAIGPLAPTVFGYSDQVEPIEHDQEEAQALMEEAGYEDLTLDILTYDRTTTDTAEFIQSELSEIGISVEIEQLEIGAYLDLTAQGEHDMFVGSWGTVTLDADYGLYPMFHSENVGAPGNRAFFQNDEVDELLEQARQSTDEQERLDLYEEAQQIIIDEAPIVSLYHSVLLAGISEEIEGFFQYPSSFPYLKDVRFTE